MALRATSLSSSSIFALESSATANAAFSAAMLAAYSSSPPAVWESAEGSSLARKISSAVLRERESSATFAFKASTSSFPPSGPMTPPLPSAVCEADAVLVSRSDVISTCNSALAALACSHCDKAASHAACSRSRSAVNSTTCVVSCSESVFPAEGSFCFPKCSLAAASSDCDAASSRSSSCTRSCALPDTEPSASPAATAEVVSPGLILSNAASSSALTWRSRLSSASFSATAASDSASDPLALSNEASSSPRATDASASSPRSIAAVASSSVTASAVILALSSPTSSESPEGAAATSAAPSAPWSSTLLASAPNSSSSLQLAWTARTNSDRSWAIMAAYSLSELPAGTCGEADTSDAAGSRSVEISSSSAALASSALLSSALSSAIADACTASLASASSAARGVEGEPASAWWGARVPGGRPRAPLARPTQPTTPFDFKGPPSSIRAASS